MASPDTDTCCLPPLFFSPNYQSIPQHDASDKLYWVVPDLGIFTLYSAAAKAAKQKRVSITAATGHQTWTGARLQWDLRCALDHDDPTGRHLPLHAIPKKKMPHCPPSARYLLSAAHASDKLVTPISQVQTTHGDSISTVAISRQPPVSASPSSTSSSPGPPPTSRSSSTSSSPGPPPTSRSSSVSALTTSPSAMATTAPDRRETIFAFNEETSTIYRDANAALNHLSVTGRIQMLSRSELRARMFTSRLGSD